jgi:hypothetical protein
MKKEKGFPTIFGLVLLIVTTFIGVKLSQKTVTTSSKASGDCQPINPQITNVTYNSAAVSFTTSAECSVTLNINNQIVNDSKDKKTVHYFEINNLENAKVFQFTIISGGNNYSSDEYTFKTAKKPEKNIPTSNLAWGRVFKPDNSVASEAIVYINIPGASPLSAIVTSSGNWNVPLSTSFNESLNDWFTPPDNTEENIFVISPGYDQTQIINNTSVNNPVPDIILGQNVLNAPTVTVNKDSSSNNLLDGNYDLTSDNKLDISNPKTNEELSTKRPDFFGTAKPGSSLKIEVHSSTAINGATSVDSDGSWNWSPSQDLAPGEHTITVTDENNNIITRKFTVLAAESNTSFSASSSASVVTPTATPTKTITVNPTPTIKPTLAPTATPIPVVKPSTSSGVPRTGDNLPTVMLLSFAFVSLAFTIIYYKKS